MHKSTKAIHAARARRQSAQPVAMPLYLSTTYERDPDGSYAEGYLYSRADNPNRRQLEQGLAMLEGGAEAIAFGSGMAAISAVLQSLKSGDHILLPDDVYFKLYQLVEDTFIRWGLTYTLVDMTDLAAVEAAIRPATCLIWMESPSNPMLKITDIGKVCDLAKHHSISTAVDNTWATPIHLLPLQLGADIVVHSTTKYFGGHSDVLGGAVICREAGDVAERIRKIQIDGGAVPSPWDCWLVTRGLQTLSLRVEAQSQRAARLASFLEQHPAVAKVYYPGLLTHSGHAIAKAQMQDGYGAMLSVRIKSGEAAARQVCNRLKLFTQATSLGGVESLVEHRQSVEGPQSSTPADLLRVSVGIEHIDDLIADWAQALSQV